MAITGIDAERSLNRDPIPGMAGAHPVSAGLSAGLSAAAGGLAVGAAVGAVAGPAGAAVSALADTVTGGFTGKGVAEMVNPTAEEKYWRENCIGAKTMPRARKWKAEHRSTTTALPTATTSMRMDA